MPSAKHCSSAAAVLGAETNNDGLIARHQLNPAYAGTTCRMSYTLLPFVLGVHGFFNLPETHGACAGYLATTRQNQLLGPSSDNVRLWVN